VQILMINTLKDSFIKRLQLNLIGNIVMNIFSKKIFTSIILLTAFMSSAFASEDKISEPFRGNTYNSDFIISYDDLDLLLKSSVLRTGKSGRSKAKKSSANIGTRMKVRINRLTATEGNRFYFEAFKKGESKVLLHNIRKSLENLPNEAPLKLFSKEEQLAYWLNLYNVTILDEIVKIYPKASLKDFLEGSDSILDQKILTVAGIKLSLNDIQFKILMEKYNRDPLIIYGLYQGIIGGPNIRKYAYTGKTVYKALEQNANEFINSNRGTYADKKNVIRVSSLYQRNADYFPHFKTDLKKHLLRYIEGYTRSKLEDSKKIKVNINDWKITDLYGSTRSFGGSTSTNNAALLNSIGSIKGTDLTSGISAADVSLVSGSIIQRSKSYGRFSPEQVEKLKKMNEMRAINTGHVTLSDLPEEDKSN
jgi:uncharacterized protein DUF547